MNKNIVMLSVINSSMRRMYEDYGTSSITATMRSLGFNVLLIADHENALDIQEIVDFEPYIIGLSMYKISKESVYNVCRRLKEAIPNVIITVGGIYPSYNHVLVLEECAHIDVAIRGEGEAVFADMAQKLYEQKDLSTVGNITYRLNGEIHINDNALLIKDLDSLPIESRDILVRNKLRVAQISTSRGCTGHCTFCAKQLFWTNWRGRSAGHVVHEMEQIYLRHGVDAFYFIDSSLEDPDEGGTRLWELLNKLIERDLPIYFFANFRADFVRNATPEMMNALVRAGLCGACIGIESFNDDDLKLYGKMATADDNRRIIEMFNQYDIYIQPGFININPYSSLDSLRNNITHLRQYQMLCNRSMFLNQLAVFKDTAIHRKIERDGLMKQIDFDEYGYDFVDSHVKKAVQFLRSYIADIPDNYNQYLNVISYYTNDFMTLFHYFKRKYHDLKSLKSAIEIFNIQIHKYINIVNDLIAKWLLELLNAVEKNKNTKELKALSDTLLLNPCLQETVEGIYKVKNNLFLESARAGTTCLDDLTHVIF